MMKRVKDQCCTLYCWSTGFAPPSESPLRMAAFFHVFCRCTCSYANYILSIRSYILGLKCRISDSWSIHIRAESFVCCHNPNLFVPVRRVFAGMILFERKSENRHTFLHFPSNLLIFRQKSHVWCLHVNHQPYINRAFLLLICPIQQSYKQSVSYLFRQWKHCVSIGETECFHR